MPRVRHLSSGSALRFFPLLLSFIGLFCWVQPGWAKTTLKVATLAPEGSSWMQTLRKADQIIRKETEGRVEFRFYPGGVLGDENVILKKMQLGQVDGALLTSGGLASIFPDIRVLEVPFLLDGYEEADSVMNAVRGYFEEGLKKNGYTPLGWSENGFVYLMSTKPLRTWEDIKRLKVWLWMESDIARSLFRELGLSGVKLQLTDVLVGLQSGLVDVVYNSPLGAIALQWFTRIKYLTVLEFAYSPGGLVVATRKYDQINSQDRETVLRVVADCMGELTRKVRGDNAEAIEIMKREGVEVITPDPEDVRRFRMIADQAMQSLSESVFSRDVFERVKAALEQKKSGNPRP